MDLCSHKHGFSISAECVFSATSYCKSQCDDIGGAVKRHVAKWNPETSFDHQILDYKPMLDLCENEVISITFFEICNESMISV